MSKKHYNNPERSFKVPVEDEKIEQEATTVIEIDGLDVECLEVSEEIIVPEVDVQPVEVVEEKPVEKVEEAEVFKPYSVKVNVSALNVRKGPGSNFDVVMCIRDKGTYIIVEEVNGWGKLESKAGWICLNFTTKI